VARGIALLCGDESSAFLSEVLGLPVSGALASVAARSSDVILKASRP
jgi:hypothetical protein